MKISARQLSSILPDIATTEKWSVYIEGIKLNNSELIPVYSVNEVFGGIESKVLELGVTSMKIPNSYTPYSLDIEFYDTDMLELYSQFYDWYKQSYKLGRVDLSTQKQINIIKYDREFNKLFSSSYKVMLETEFKFLGTNDVQTLTNTVAFNIIDVINIGWDK